MIATMSPHERWKSVTPKEQRTKPISLQGFVEKVEQTKEGKFYFSKNTMQYFGDRLSNFGIRHAIIDTEYETNVAVYELYRKKPVVSPNFPNIKVQASAYFRKDTFSRVTKFPKYKSTGLCIF